MSDMIVKPAQAPYWTFMIRAYSYLLLSIGFFALMPYAHTQTAQNSPENDKSAAKPSAFDKRHTACLDAISDDTERAYENALRWKTDGGGYRADHCIAMALFALERTELAAQRLENIAIEGIGFDRPRRVDFYHEAVNFWLLAGEAQKAYNLSSTALKLSPNHIDLRIARARAYAALERYDFAAQELSIILRLSPNHAEAYRYRADAYRQQGELETALIDIETSLELDPEQVETALLRGEIREAIRLKKLETSSSETSPDKQK